MSLHFRPQEPAMPHEATFNLRISVEERARWTAHAKSLGVKTSRFVRDAVRRAVEGVPEVAGELRNKQPRPAPARRCDRCTRLQLDKPDCPECLSLRSR